MAIARNSSGLLANQDLNVTIAILTGMPGEYTVLWEERHAVRTNNEGLFRLEVGDPTAERLETSTVTYFSDIDWHIQPMYVRTMINEFEMGISPLFSVPYALLAKDIEGPVNKLGVEGTTDLMDEALFEVKNKDGQIIFAVYNEGVRIYVDDAGTKTAKGGFAIGSFGSTSKDGTPYQDYFKVNPGVINAYIDDTPGKTAKGGFAIGGFGSKSGPSNYLQVDMDKIKAGKVDYLNITAINTFIGTQAGIVNSIGQYNAFMGYNAGLSNIRGSSNVFIGNESGKSNIWGSSNVFIGYNAGYSDTASYNSFIGYQAGRANKGGQYNSFMGYNAGLSNTSGTSNVFIGHQSGVTNTTGKSNVFIGTNAGFTSNGDYNIAIGDYAGTSLTTGNVNILIGQSAGRNHTTQEYNVMIGQNAGYHLLGGSFWAGSFNTFMGINAGYKIANGKENVFLGTNAGYFIENGFGNTIVGIDAGRSGEEHNLGYDASYNTLLGDKSAYSITSGDENVVIGYQAGASLTSGSGNVFIGTYSGYPETGSNKLYIANSYDEDSPTPPLIYGDFSSGLIGLGTTSPGYKLDVVGDINITGNFRVNGSPLSTTTLTTGNLTATGPISLSATQKVIGGPAAISIANASTSASGAVQLSNSYVGSSQVLATTEKALTDGLATKVTGTGMTMGKVYLTGHGGNIVTDAGGTFTLTWNADGDWILLTNTNTAKCSWWYYIQNPEAPTTGNTGVVDPSTDMKIITPVATNDNTGFEIHFGQADGTAGWCSVWLQYCHGVMVGHYMKY